MRFGLIRLFQWTRFALRFTVRAYAFPFVTLGVLLLDKMNLKDSTVVIVIFGVFFMIVTLPAWLWAVALEFIGTQEQRNAYMEYMQALVEPVILVSARLLRSHNLAVEIAESISDRSNKAAAMTFDSKWAEEGF
jgi:hypothetical protein